VFSFGCGDVSVVTPVSRELAKAHALSVAEAATAGTYPAVCGTSRQAQRGGPVFLLSSRSCFTCKGVGNLLRKFQTAHSNLTVVVPEPDTSELCPFYRLERIHASTVAIPEATFASDSFGPVVFFVLPPDSAGKWRVVAGKDADELGYALSRDLPGAP
jgi:hypothetical protein